MIPLAYYFILTLIFLFTLKLFLQTRRSKNIPPGPPYLPIIGNLHQLKDPLHRTLHRFSQRYGQIYSLRFGSRLAVVISSLSAVQECFTKNDVVLANRPKLLIGKYLGYNHTSLLFSPYGDHWRNLRRITTAEVLSTNRLNDFVEMRKDEIMRLVQKLGLASYKGFVKVEMKTRLAELTFNTIMRMIAGKRYLGEDCELEINVEEANKFRKMIAEMVAIGGANHPADFLPFLKWFDFAGFENKVKDFYKRTDAFLQGLIDELREGKNAGDTMIGYLLSLRESQPQYFTDQLIKSLVLVMLIAGTDTASLTLEWAMSNLLNQPEVLKKAKKEIDTYIGLEERLIDEADISKLPHLQNIITETMRLYPAAPLLVPHFSSDDCSIGGHDVPRGTMVLINAWTIHRDPQLWNDHLSFKPERFEKEGEAKKLITFGLGRRACPGAGLAQRTIGLTLALLIQCFEWKRVNDEEIDMTEGVGITLPKKIPLEAMCEACHPIINKVLCEGAIDN